MTSKILLGSFLVLTLSSCATISPMPNTEFCASLTDPFDILVEEQKGYCKFALSNSERELTGEKWKETVRTGVIVDMAQFEQFLIWARTTCRKTNNECVLRK